jgi:regulator of sigma E protease
LSIVFSNIFYWIFAALLLGIVIVLHELGHFWAARLSGLRVMSFSVGFGPRLYARTGKDGVLYTIRLLPIGGYCRFYGEDESVANEKDAFYLQPIWKRALTTVCGPLMNMLTAVLAFFVLYAMLGIPAILPVVDSVVPDSPAQQAGLLPGDRFVEANGEPVNSSADLQNLIEVSGGVPITLTVDRLGEQIELTLTPRVIDSEAGRPQIGIWFSTINNRRYGIIQSVQMSFAMTKETIVAMFDFLRNLITRGQGAGDMVGPIGTVRVVREQTEYGGIRAYLSMLAMISVNLGFFNLLPIPGLDGSRLLFLLMEAIRRKRIDPNKEGLVHLVGIALLLLLMLPVYVRDILNLF